MTTAEINLYGRKVTLRAVWFLAQGYCQDAADYCMEEAAAGRYDPNRFAVWTATHVVTCRQCTYANRVKGSIIEFLRVYHPEWSERYKQGYTPPVQITKEWLAHLQNFNPDAVKAFKKIRTQVMANSAEFERYYGGGHG